MWNRTILLLIFIQPTWVQKLFRWEANCILANCSMKVLLSRRPVVRSQPKRHSDASRNCTRKSFKFTKRNNGKLEPQNFSAESKRPEKCYTRESVKKQAARRPHASNRMELNGIRRFKETNWTCSSEHKKWKVQAWSRSVQQKGAASENAFQRNGLSARSQISLDVSLKLN